MMDYGSTENLVSDSKYRIEEIRKHLTDGKLKIKFVSNSMSPVLATWKEAEIEACSLDQLKFLDIVVFQQDAKLICHCFLSIGAFLTPSRQRTFVCRGLNSREYNVLITEDDLVGRVKSHQIHPWQYVLYRRLNRWIGSRLTRLLFGWLH